ncbi:MAG: ATP-binding protein [Chloroflexi bacterium]|nr:MAG: ATP-binding protein [Chloroflexota bacterium]MBL1194460.1 ATP-binding protein [Chloroflexota bacterium]NOH11747.1 ATP-binding protein [Chloroflexota bacterium]
MIKLKKEWDSTTKVPRIERNFESKGLFSGRKTELSKLINEIRNKTSGSILISGHRGVGKTSLAYYAISVAMNNSNSIIPVVLNAAQLEIESLNKDVEAKRILENLIRRLYSATRQHNQLKTDNAIKELYRKAIASEFTQEENIQHLRENKKNVARKSSLEIQIHEIGLKSIFIVGSWIISGLVFFGQLLPSNNLNALIAFLLAIPIPVVINYYYSVVKSSEETEQLSIKADQVYKLDNSVGNLEFDLEKIHRDISNRGNKVVYLIDELDKLNRNNVEEILKYFKTLFTLSDAIFIFVGGEELYSIGASNDKLGINRPPEYTYFTSRYFITRPLWSDISSFLDNIIQETDINSNALNDFKRALCFEATNDFFELRQTVKDRIDAYDKDGFPLIIYEQNEVDTTKARFQKSITTLLEDKYLSRRISKWKENEELIRAIFVHAHELHSSPIGFSIQDPRTSFLEDSLIRDANWFFSRLGIISKAGTGDVITVNNIEIQLYQYSFTGVTPTEPPDALGEPTEYERQFMGRFEEFCELLRVLANVYYKYTGQEGLTTEEFWEDPKGYASLVDQWGVDVSTRFNAEYPIYKALSESNPLPNITREDIDGRSLNLTSSIASMNQSLHTMIPKLLISIFDRADLQISTLSENTELFSSTANRVRELASEFKVPNPQIVFKADLSRQIMVVNNQMNFLEKSSNALREHINTHRVVSVEDPNNRLVRKGIHIVTRTDAIELERTLDDTIKNLSQFLGSSNPDKK